ncbi:MAG: sulfotransferase [Acidimicrobiales bacterium]
MGIRHGREFERVERFCFFVGYSRSGHTLVASLLNAHPEMVVSNEADSLRFFQHGFRRSQIFALILACDELFESKGRRWEGYEYSVPNQFQGSFTRLRVIGDKKANRSTRRLLEDPGLLDRIRRVVRVPIRVVHVTRNPFDNIARMTVIRTGSSLSKNSDRYERLCESVSLLRDRLAPDELFEIRYEDVISSPSAALTDLCGFLGVEPDDDYLTDCASIVHPPARRARDLIKWTSDDCRRVSQIIERYHLLDAYSFSS